VLPYSSHKYVRTPSPTPSQPVKRPRQRTAHGEALLSVSDSLAKFSTTIAAAFAPPPSSTFPTTPACRSQAVKTALAQESWLTPSQMVSFIDYLRNDSTAFDIYMVLDDIDICKEWVGKQLDL
jgi:hypothetical protein